MRIKDDVLKRARLACKKLTLFRNLSEDDEIFADFDALLGEFLNPKGSRHKAFQIHHRLTGKLLEHSLNTPFPPVGSIWQDYILDSILLAENHFTVEVVKHKDISLPNIVEKAVQEDLKALQSLFNLDAEVLAEAIKEFLADCSGEEAALDWCLLPWQQTTDASPRCTGYALQLKQSFKSGMSWDRLLEPLIFYYRTVGTGSFSYCYAFRFLNTEAGAVLKPILEPDPVRFSDLIGYELQRRQVIANTEQFLKGFPANNLLLYGERGTGKSSTIKALVHEYGQQGLRMVEMVKHDLARLPSLLELIRHRPHRFIIFIDDLSFEEGETDYKHLKAVLEGSLEARPDNVLIYATSNRRHLIKERFSDREFNSDEEVRIQDTLQEKMSLADRFGMTVVFTSPDQEQYLEIVQGLAKQAGLDIAPGELREQALRWALWHNGRSGRTARQFIDDLAGRLGMEAGDGH